MLCNENRNRVPVPASCLRQTGTEFRFPRAADFCRLLDVAEKTSRRDDVYLAIGGCGITDEMEANEILDLIWAMKYAHLNVKHIRKVTQLSQKDFAEKYGFRRRTYEDWEAEAHEPPEYLHRLLAWAVFSDLCGISPEEDWRYHSV